MRPEAGNNSSDSSSSSASVPNSAPADKEDVELDKDLLTRAWKKREEEKWNCPGIAQAIDLNLSSREFSQLVSQIRRYFAMREPGGEGTYSPLTAATLQQIEPKIHHWIEGFRSQKKPAKPTQERGSKPSSSASLATAKKTKTAKKKKPSKGKYASDAQLTKILRDMKKKGEDMTVKSAREVCLIGSERAHRLLESIGVAIRVGGGRRGRKPEKEEEDATENDEPEEEEDKHDAPEIGNQAEREKKDNGKKRKRQEAASGGRNEKKQNVELPPDAAELKQRAERAKDAVADFKRALDARAEARKQQAEEDEAAEEEIQDIFK